MSQVNTRLKEAATYVGKESTFATQPATLYRAFPIENSFSTEITQAELENNDQRTTLYSLLPTVFGLKDGKLKLEFHGKVPSTQLTDGTSPTITYLANVLDTAMGSVAAGQGSITTAGSTVNTVNVSVGDGAGFTIGSWIAVESSAGVLEPCRITNIATDAISVYPPLSNAPGTGAAVINGMTFAPAQNNTSTLFVQHALVGASDQQWVLSGSTVNLGVEVKRNELVKFMFEGEVGSWTGPFNQSISTATAADTMTSPFAVRDAIVLFRQSGTSVATRTPYNVAEFSVKTNGIMQHINELGGTEGKTGAFRKGQRMFAEATLKFRYDNSIDQSTWANQTAMQCVVIVPKGSGTSKRFIAIDLPYTYIVGKPKIVNESGMVYMEVTLHAAQDDSITTATTDMALAPMRVALI